MSDIFVAKPAVDERFTAKIIQDYIRRNSNNWKYTIYFYDKGKKLNHAKGADSLFMARYRARKHLKYLRKNVPFTENNKPTWEIR